MEAPRTNNENSYKNILKRISVFGGIQVFNILVNLIRGKFVALFLGPSGMGISSLFLTSSAPLQQLGSLGVNLSLVKEVSATQSDTTQRTKVMGAARFLILFTSLLGVALTIVLAPWLSEWSFGSKDYTLEFVMLAAFVGLSIAGSGYLALLQGMGEVKRLSKASIVGSLTGLFFGVPLYWMFGTAGIVPAMIILSIAIFLFYYISYRKASHQETASFSWQTHSNLAKRIVTLGIIFMIGSLVGSATNYAINAFVRYTGSLADVGLFQAANSITNQYMGIVFSALAMDYFPRISAVSNDDGKLRNVTNRQAEIVVLIATPLVLTVIPFVPFIIRLLLSTEFLSTVPLVRWLSMGVLLQSVSFPLGYIFIAKDNRKTYVWVEVIFGNVLWIVCSVIFYSLYGLIGLGISLVVRTIIDIIINYILCRHYFSFNYSRHVALTIAVCLLLGGSGFVCSLIDNVLTMICMWAIPVVSICISAIRLRQLLRSDTPAPV